MACGPWILPTIEELRKVSFITRTSCGEHQKNKHISTIVDVGDKNCLAELTAELKLYHGARQWLYIIAGVLFFGTFFWTSKRKYINRYALSALLP